MISWDVVHPDAGPTDKPTHHKQLVGGAVNYKVFGTATGAVLLEKGSSEIKYFVDPSDNEKEVDELFEGRIERSAANQLRIKIGEAAPRWVSADHVEAIAATTHSGSVCDRIQLWYVHRINQTAGRM